MGPTPTWTGYIHPSLWLGFRNSCKTSWMPCWFGGSSVVDTFFLFVETGENHGILQKWWDLVEVAYFFLWNQGKRPYICMCPWKNVCCKCKSYTLVTVTIYRSIGLVDIAEELHVCKHQTRIFGNSCFFSEYGLAFIPLGLTLWSRKSFRGHGDFLYSRFETYMMNLRTFGKALQGNSS